MRILHAVIQLHFTDNTLYTTQVSSLATICCVRLHLNSITVPEVVFVEYSSHLCPVIFPPVTQFSFSTFVGMLVNGGDPFIPPISNLDHAMT